jgi:hypothetical protein
MARVAATRVAATRDFAFVFGISVTVKVGFAMPGSARNTSSFVDGVTTTLKAGPLTKSSRMVRADTAASMSK